MSQTELLSVDRARLFSRIQDLSSGSDPLARFTDKSRLPNGSTTFSLNRKLRGIMTSE